MRVVNYDGLGQQNLSFTFEDLTSRFGRLVSANTEVVVRYMIIPEAEHNFKTTNKKLYNDIFASLNYSQELATDIINILRDPKYGYKIVSGTDFGQFKLWKKLAGKMMDPTGLYFLMAKLRTDSRYAITILQNGEVPDYRDLFALHYATVVQTETGMVVDWQTDLEIPADFDFSAGLDGLGINPILATRLIDLGYKAGVALIAVLGLWGVSEIVGGLYTDITSGDAKINLESLEIQVELAEQNVKLAEEINKPTKKVVEGALAAAAKNPNMTGGDLVAIVKSLGGTINDASATLSAIVSGQQANIEKGADVAMSSTIGKAVWAGAGILAVVMAFKFGKQLLEERKLRASGDLPVGKKKPPRLIETKTKEV